MTMYYIVSVLFLMYVWCPCIRIGTTGRTSARNTIPEQEPREASLEFRGEPDGYSRITAISEQGYHRPG